MGELPWSKFFWSDWEADQGLRLCSLPAQGLWMRILCVCAKGDPKGYLAINGKPLNSTDVARLCGITADEVDPLMVELDLNGVFSRDRRGWIYSRRMVRDAKRRNDRQTWQSIRKKVLDKDGEKCAYCGDECGPFHVDHVTPRSRGGRHSFDNLVVACAACNLSKGAKTVEEWLQ